LLDHLDSTSTWGHVVGVTQIDYTFDYYLDNTINFDDQYVTN